MLTLNFHPFPTLETERLVLRRILKSDAEDLFNLRTNAEAMFYLDRKKPASINAIYELIELMDEGINTNTAVAWGIQLKSQKGLIGHFGYHRIKLEHYRAEVGYMIQPAYWKQGIASEALVSVLDYGFNIMKVHSIEADINPANIASAALLKKFGFVKEAYFKENYFYNGKFLDSEIYSLIKNTTSSQ